MQVHQLRVVVHAVQNLRVDWLRDRRVEVGRLLAVRTVEPHVLVVVVIRVQHLAEDVPFILVRVPELRQLLLFLLLCGHRHADERQVAGSLTHASPRLS